MKTYIVHTDGSCLNNPGRGGWAAIIDDGEVRREISGGARLTTNNRMELTAVIEALRALPAEASVAVKIYTDSQLLVNSIEKGWARKWRANNWKRNKNDRAENPDLWKQLLDEIDMRMVQMYWIKAHAGSADNERCDELAKREAEYATAIDQVYEDQKSGSSVRLQESLLDANPEKPSYHVTLENATRKLKIRHPQNGSLTVPLNELDDLFKQISKAVAPPLSR